MGTRTPPPEKRKPQMSGASEASLQCPPIHSKHLAKKREREIAEIVQVAPPSILWSPP